MKNPRYRVAHLGLGRRGTIHADAFLELSDRYELVGLCELRQSRLEEYCRDKQLSTSICYTDAEQMLAKTKPDLFCFITLPSTPRQHFVELAAKYGVKAIAMEKPMATSLAEASAILRVSSEHGIKAVVSHQQKYLTSMQKMKATLDEGQIGKISLMTASCQLWMAQLGTHFVDYVQWMNGFRKAEWVVGHVHGKELLADHHPSPNYVMGQISFENDVRGFVEFGRLSASHIQTDKIWFDNRLTAFGERGHVWAETDGRWGSLIDGKSVVEQGTDWDYQERKSAATTLPEGVDRLA